MIEPKNAFETKEISIHRCIGDAALASYYQWIIYFREFPRELRREELWRTSKNYGEEATKRRRMSHVVSRTAVRRNRPARVAHVIRYISNKCNTLLTFFKHFFGAIRPSSSGRGYRFLHSKPVIAMSAMQPDSCCLLISIGIREFSQETFQRKNLWVRISLWKPWNALFF